MRTLILILLFALPCFAQEVTLITVAGDKTQGYRGDNQPASEAQFDYPHGLAVDQNGHVYIADQQNQRIRKIDTQTGLITTIAGNGHHGYGGDGQLATQAQLGAPLGVFITPNGDIYIADSENNRIRKIDAQTNIISTIAGTGSDGFTGDGGPATQATLWHPRNVFVTALGNIYIADTKNNCIRKIDAQTNIISTIAGTGDYGYSGDDSLATEASLGYPTQVWVSETGDLYILDYSNHRIRRVDAGTGLIQTVGPTQNNKTPLSYPNDFIFHSDGAIYVSDSAHNRILKLKNNVWSLVGGTGQAGFQDGDIQQATLNYPAGIAIDNNNTLYIADRFNHSIRKITHINQIQAQPLQSDTFSSWPLNPPQPKTAPVATADSIDVKPNGRINIDVLQNDFDREGDSLILTAITQGAHSERVVLNSNSTIHYRPLPDYEGEDQFTYTISDGNGGTATGHVFITIIDRPPVVNRTIPTQSFFINETVQIDLGGSQPVIKDPQNEPLDLVVTSLDNSIATPTLNGYLLTVTGQKPGNTTIQITGTDSTDQTASTTFLVIVKDPAPQIGTHSLSKLLETFQRSIQSNDVLAMTGPTTTDTLNGAHRDHIYISSLSKKCPANKVQAIRSNYDQLQRKHILTDIRFGISYEDIQEQETTAHVNALIFFISIGRPNTRSQPYLDLPPQSFSIEAIKLSSGWVIDNIPEILEQAAKLTGIADWPKVRWQPPNLVLSSSSPPITFNLNAEPHLFESPSNMPLTYTVRVSFITGFQGIKATVQDTFLTLTPQPWGDNTLILTADNASGGTADLFLEIQVKREAPITTSDSAQVIQGEFIDIPVLQNDRAISPESLTIISTSQGAKSQSIQILNKNQIRYAPKQGATGTDRFTYRVADNQGNLADGFVFVFIQAQKVTPDFNRDGRVNFSDFILFASAFGSTDSNYDLDGDGQVSFPDFILFGQAFDTQ